MGYEYTKGEWIAYETGGGLTICARKDNGQGIAATINDTTVSYLKKKGNARLIAAAVNACASVNPDNPLAVAESIKDMHEALKGLCIAYNIDEKSIIVGIDPSYWEKTLQAIAKAEGVDDGNE